MDSLLYILSRTKFCFRVQEYMLIDFYIYNVRLNRLFILHSIVEFNFLKVLWEENFGRRKKPERMGMKDDRVYICVRDLYIFVKYFIFICIYLYIFFNVTHSSSILYLYIYVHESLYCRGIKNAMYRLYNFRCINIFIFITNIFFITVGKVEVWLGWRYIGNFK